MKKSLGVLPGNVFLYTKSMGFMGHFLYNTKIHVNFSRLCQKLVITVSLMPPPQKNAKENCENVKCAFQKITYL